MSSKGAFQVGPDVVATLRYEVFDAEGELVGGSDGAREVLFGHGELLPALEHALEGALPGDRRSVRLSVKDAFGARDPTALLEVDKHEFPADVAPGDSFEAEGQDGVRIVLKVLDVLADHVVVDQNHPLAGQALRVEAEIVATRPASQAELAAAAERDLHEAAEAESPLVPAERLLRGPSRG